MDKHDLYENPLIRRYSSAEMAELFSEKRKFTTWRRLWVVLAQAERELGLPITQQQIDELEAAVDQVDIAAADAYEKQTRHDVMAHVLAYGDQCPSARGIIHLGATSCYVGDNTDILLMRDACSLIKRRLLSTLSNLADFAMKYRELPTLGFTHFQSAQLTTVGKRAALWIHELLLDYEQLEHFIASLKLRGVKGTTGTQASFMTLFNGDESKVKALETLVVQKLGFAAAYPVTGQTYSRKVDSHALNMLSGIAQSAHKFACDIRLLQGLKEIEEPFESTQIGSSAMAYKRNPMRSERICALARFAMSLSENAAVTASTQWLERTLDDSANRRLSVPQAFLAVDAVLRLYQNVSSALVVNDKVIARRVQEELPFMATETILMQAVKRGGDRQALHEKIRQYSMQAGARVKGEGLDNDLAQRIVMDEAFAITPQEMDALLDARDFIGRAASQTEELINDCVLPILRANGVRAAEPDAIEL